MANVLFASDKCRVFLQQDIVWFLLTSLGAWRIITRVFQTFFFRWVILQAIHFQQVHSPRMVSLFMSLLIKQGFMPDMGCLIMVDYDYWLAHYPRSVFVGYMPVISEISRVHSLKKRGYNPEKRWVPCHQVTSLASNLCWEVDPFL